MTSASGLKTPLNVLHDLSGDVPIIYNPRPVSPPTLNNQACGPREGKVFKCLVPKYGENLFVMFHFESNSPQPPILSLDMSFRAYEDWQRKLYRWFIDGKGNHLTSNSQYALLESAVEARVQTVLRTRYSKKNAILPGLLPAQEEGLSTLRFVDDIYTDHRVEGVKNFPTSWSPGPTETDAKFILRLQTGFLKSGMRNMTPEEIMQRTILSKVRNKRILACKAITWPTNSATLANLVHDLDLIAERQNRRIRFIYSKPYCRKCMRHHLSAEACLCYRCEGQHTHGLCKFVFSVCLRCRQPGHLSRVCRVVVE